MTQRIYRVADAAAAARLTASGARIAFRFHGSVVLDEPLARPIDGVTEIDLSRLAAEGPVTMDNLGERAWARRTSAEWRARKARRPHVGVPMDQIIGGTTGGRTS